MKALKHKEARRCAMESVKNRFTIGHAATRIPGVLAVIIFSSQESWVRHSTGKPFMIFLKVFQKEKS